MIIDVGYIDPYYAIFMSEGCYLEIRIGRLQIYSFYNEDPFVTLKRALEMVPDPGAWLQARVDALTMEDAL